MKLGLINGVSGKALYFFLLKNKKKTKQGQRLLNIVAQNIYNSNDYSFENGIVGFGWLIAFLSQEKYIKINSDDILEDFDDQIYKLTLNETSKENINITTLLGLTNYHIIRHRNKNLNEQYYRKFIHEICLNLIFEKLILYIKDSISKEKVKKKQILSCCQILMRLSYSMNYLNNKMINTILIEYTSFFISYIKNNKLQIKHYKKELLYILITTNNQKYVILKNEIPIADSKFYIKKNIKNIKETIFILTNVYCKKSF